MWKILVFIAYFACCLAHAQQVGTSSLPMQSGGRLGVEAGGYLNRGAGSGALARFTGAWEEGAAFELGLGGSTGSHGARALAAARTRIMAEDGDFPALYLRGGVESYGDEDRQRRNAVGGGPMLSRGFVVSGQEIYAYAHPTAKLGLEERNDAFVWLVEGAFGLNARLPTDAPLVASLEMDLGFTNAASALMVGVATDFE